MKDKEPFDWSDSITTILSDALYLFLIALILKWSYATAVPVFFPTAPMLTFWQTLAALLLVRFGIMPFKLMLRQKK